MQITGFRFFSVYGPYGRPDMAIWLFADSILKDKPVKVFGKGGKSEYAVTANDLKNKSDIPILLFLACTGYQ